MQRILACLIILFCLNPRNILAEVPALVQDAFTAMEKINKQEWSYTRTTRDGKKIRVERYTPGIEPEWELISVNGKDPSVKNLNKYLINKAKNKGDKNQENSFSDLALDDSWKLVAEDDMQATYEFKPKPDGPEDQAMNEFILGTMILAKDKPHVKIMHLQSTRPFKPMKMVKILEMNVNIEFADIGNQEYFMVNDKNKVIARAMGLKKVQDLEISNSDFSRVPLE